MSKPTPRKAYPSDLTDEQWEVLDPLLPPPDPEGRPLVHPRREIFNTILYVLRTECAWRQLPHDLPHWQTVYESRPRLRVFLLCTITQQSIWHPSKAACTSSLPPCGSPRWSSTGSGILVLPGSPGNSAPIIPTASYVELPQVGHLPWLEQPNLLRGVLRPFLERVYWQKREKADS